MVTPPGVPVRTDADVLARVAELVAPAEREPPALWLFFLDGEQRLLPVVVPVDGIPDEPEPYIVRNLCWIISNVITDGEPGGSVVIALTRPGPPLPDDTVTAWHDALREAAGAEGAPVRMICLATPEGTAALPAP